jgi:hypothetical protein
MKKHLVGLSVYILVWIFSASLLLGDTLFF